MIWIFILLLAIINIVYFNDTGSINYGFLILLLGILLPTLKKTFWTKEN